MSDGYDGDAISDQEWGSADEERLEAMFDEVHLGDDEPQAPDDDDFTDDPLTWEEWCIAMECQWFAVASDDEVTL